MTEEERLKQNERHRLENLNGDQFERELSLSSVTTGERVSGGSLIVHNIFRHKQIVHNIFNAYLQIILIDLIEQQRLWRSVEKEHHPDKCTLFGNRNRPPYK